MLCKSTTNLWDKQANAPKRTKKNHEYITKKQYFCSRKNMKNYFYDNIVENNTIVVNKIYRLMREKMHSVREILSNPKIVPTDPVLYRWWVPCDGCVINSLLQKSKEFPCLRPILENMEMSLLDNKPYYAIYFGKSENGKTRIVTQHIKGNVGNSTIRHTLYGILINDKYNPNNEDCISKIMENTYFEWHSFKQTETELIVPLEAICIALGNYPLNIDGNCAVNKDWLEHLKTLRKTSKKPK